MGRSPFHYFTLCAVVTVVAQCNHFNGAFGGLGYIIWDDITKGSPGIQLVQSGGSTSVTEGGGNDSYTITLSGKPTATVHIVVTPNEQTTANGMSSAFALVFTSGNWSVPQTITVRAVDDMLMEGQHQGLITHAMISSDMVYASMSIPSVEPAITDNDTPGVSVTPTAGSVSATEGGTGGSYTIVLTTQPTADVNITITPDAQATVNGSATPIIISFTTITWNTAQNITVAAVDDAVMEGNHTSLITHTASSADAAYNAIAISNITASITYNDTAGVSISESAGSTDISEAGQTDTYTVVLTTQPTSSVNITVTPPAQTTVNGSSTPVVLTFTAGACPAVGNWCTAQTVTAAFTDDSIATGDRNVTITHSAASTDPSYNGISVNSVVANAGDNDIAGVLITESAGSTAVSEAGVTDSYDVVLTSEPTQAVTVQLTFDDAQLRANGGTSPATLTFTAGACPGIGNWCTAQTVTVSAVDDAVSETLMTTSSITHSATSADANYTGIAIVSVTSNVTDNDLPGVTKVESSGSTSVVEGGAADTYTLVLNSQPSANVDITVTPNDGEVTVNGSANTVLTFTTGACPGVGNWCTPQTVSVAVTNNVSVDGSRTRSIAHSVASGDAGYNGLAVAGVSVAVTDDDTPGVIITESGAASNVSEGGVTDSYTVVLVTAPSSSVTITVTPGTQVKVNGSSSPITLTFTTGNWSSAQTVTVSATNDAQATGSIHNSAITHSSSSADGSYNGLPVSGVTVHISDNEFVIFATSTTTMGNTGGIAGADAICNADANRPFTSSTYKAFLVDGAARRACTSKDCQTSGNGEHINWVLAPSTSYYRANGSTLIETTTAVATFNFNMSAAITGSGVSYFTGIKPDYTTDGGNYCASWTGTGGHGKIGTGNETGSKAISNNNQNCNDSFALLCVEQ